MNYKRVGLRILLLVLLLALVAGLIGAQPAGAAQGTLDAPLATQQDVLDFAVSPDGRYAVYRTSGPRDGAIALYGVPLSGGDPLPLSSAAHAGGVVEPDYQVSPDGNYVVFRASGDRPGTTILYSVPLEGSGAVEGQIGGPIAGRGKVGYFHITPDSSRVIYRADRQGDGVYELYSVPIAGPATAGVKLNGALVDGGNVYHSFVSPDAQWVVYIADQEENEVLELYSVPIAGPAGDGIKLSGNMADGGDVASFLVSPDAAYVVYQADERADGQSEIWAVPIKGPSSAAIRLNRDLVEAGNVHSFLISPDSSRVIYLADQDVKDRWELYSVPAAGPAHASIKLSGALVRGGDVTSFFVSPDSSRVIYLADQDVDNVQELYRVLIAGPASAGIKLNTTLIDGGGVASAEIGPGSTHVVYRADARAEDVYELYSVPSAGPASAGVQLNPLLPPGGDVISYQISADGRYVIYLADHDSDEIAALYSVPVTGPATAAIKLSTSDALGGSVWSFQLVPESGDIVFRAELDGTGVDELYITMAH